MKHQKEMEQLEKNQREQLEKLEKFNEQVQTHTNKRSRLRKHHQLYSTHEIPGTFMFQWLEAGVCIISGNFM